MCTTTQQHKQHYTQHQPASTHPTKAANPTSNQASIHHPTLAPAPPLLRLSSNVSQHPHVSPSYQTHHPRRSHLLNQCHQLHAFTQPQLLAQPGAVLLPLVPSFRWIVLANPHACPVFPAMLAGCQFMACSVGTPHLAHLQLI